MNKREFINKLDKELDFMPDDDREAAIVFYEEYFDDAGAENEDSIIDELGSPIRLAAQLKEEYESGITEPSGKDLAVPGSQAKKKSGSKAKYKSPFSSSGPGVRSPLGNDPFAEEEPEPEPEPEKKSGEYNYSKDDLGGDNSWKSSGYSAYGSYDERRGPYGSRQAAGEEPISSWFWRKTNDVTEKAKEKKREYDSKKAEEKKRYDYERPPKYDNPPPRQEPREKRKLSVPAIILICLLAIPIGIPLAGGLFALFAAAAAVFIALVCVGGAIMVAGVAAIVAGAWFAGFTPNLLLMIGLGLIMFGLGLPVIYWSAKALGGVCKSIGRGLKALFTRPNRGGQGNDQGR